MKASFPTAADITKGAYYDLFIASPVGETLLSRLQATVFLV